MVSFDAISYAAGLTRMKFWRFLLATSLGLAPACFVHAYVGDRAPGTLDILLAAFGIFVAGAVVRRRRRRKSVP